MKTMLDNFTEQYGDPSELASVRNFTITQEMLPYRLARDFSVDVDEQEWELVDGMREPVGRLVEIISMPWFENGVVRIMVRDPDDPTTLREVQWPDQFVYPQSVE